MYKKIIPFFFLILVLVSEGCNKNKFSKKKEPTQAITQQEFLSVLDLIKKSYVIEVDNSLLMQGAINGMLRALDPFSEFLDEKGYAQLQELLRGEYAGVGLEVVYKDGYLEVISPIDQSPAHKAGIQPGDIITHLNDVAIKNIKSGLITTLFHGDTGTELRLTLKRKNMSQPLQITLERSFIRPNPVISYDFNNVLYTRIRIFNDQTAEEFNKVIKTELKKYKALVLDLRNNPGGTFDQAVTIGTSLLGQKKILQIKGRTPDLNKEVQGKYQELIPSDFPIVVLINEGSASASEILAGALQDHKRAIIIGTTSFGKGSIQNLIPISNRQGAIKLTAAYFFTPSGKQIEHKGIIPDILVSIPDNSPSSREPSFLRETLISDPQFIRAYDLALSLSIIKEHKMQ